MINLPMKQKKQEYDVSYTQNRELSWLRFNERVLEEAEDETVPLYERLKFVEIFTSNLDEFFMVRVGSLFDLSHIQPDKRDNKSLLTAAQQLQLIFSACRKLYVRRAAAYTIVSRKLEKKGIVHRRFPTLDVETQRYFEQEFTEKILPMLSPQIIDRHHPFPHLENKELFVAALLRCNRRVTLGMIPLPASLPRYMLLPSNKMEYLLLEEIIQAFLYKIFPSYPIIDRAVFAITRNADVSPDDEEVGYSVDYLEQMKKALHKRRHLPPVRLEVQADGDSLIAPYLAKRLSIPTEQVYVTPAPLTLGYVYALEDTFTETQRHTLCYPEFSPVSCKERFGSEPVMDIVHHRDVLLSYPYDDFGAFLQVVREAVYDPAVVSVKITIYRIGKGHVKLMNYLILGAELGKEITVLLELKARFDEENNMGWIDSLQDAGCHILYGFEGYKVHAKLCLITSCVDGEIHYITHVGTGNFNAKTAKLYTDMALLTSNEEIGRDAAMFFRNMGISNLFGSYAHLLVAPVNLKKQLLDLIQQEIDKVARGENGRILLKMNSLTDRELIDKLAEAGRAGVEIHLIIRGICCLVPEIPGKTEHIHARSIVGRFLEHARVFVFGEGAACRIDPASADWMTRNTENRVEVACPVYDRELQQQILNMLLLQLADNVKARRIGRDGCYHHIHSSAKGFVDAQRNLALHAHEKKA